MLMPQSDCPDAKSVVLIAGPTASGKSAYALQMAQAKNGVVINADSMQVYAELCVTTARPSKADMAVVPHRLYGHIAARDSYSVARWQQEALAVIGEAHNQGRLPIICGGTGLYFMSLVKGLSEIPEIRPELREQWRSFTGNLHEALMAKDKRAATRLHPSDRQRLIRALEVIDSTGHSLLHWQELAEASAPLRNFRLSKQFINVSREELYRRAEQRFDQMLEQGALAEVAALPSLDPNSPLLKAIGVPELQAHLRKEISLAEATIAAKTATRQYIKRQLTFYRGQMADWQMVTL